MAFESTATLAHQKLEMFYGFARATVTYGPLSCLDISAHLSEWSLSTLEIRGSNPTII